MSKIMAAADPEVIDVRADEAFDAARLEPWLRERLPEAEGPMELRQFGGGHANLTYMVRFGAREYVLRRPPLGPVAPSSHDMKREHRVLSRLHEAFALAPQSYLLCEDPEIIGAEFHVMERRHGIVIRTDLPERFQGQPDLNRRIGEMIVDTLADLHRVDPEKVGLGDLGRPDGFAQRQLDGWTKRWHAAKDQDLDTVDRMVAYLAGQVPTPQKAALLHNDYKLDNMMVDGDDPGKAVAVFDWDMCTLGDPLMDLGYLLNFWVQGDDDAAWLGVTGMPTHHDGFPTRDEVIARYAERSGFDLGDVRWYYVFGVFKLVVIIQQIYIRYLRGQTKDERFAIFGERVAGLAAKGVGVMEGRGDGGG